ncbi:MAG: peptidoglycan editing factor PgeF [Oscillospiraceae bacterium]|nr:peptidoglycan editing factor PgeF [Oscillospiraceae bacterium]
MAIALRRNGGLTYFIDDQIRVPHAFTTRLGGVSEGIYESLNLGVARGDDPIAVTENYDRILAELGTVKQSLVFSRQVHENTVRVVDRSHRLPDLFGPVEEGDGLVTVAKGVTLAVFTADCIPILLWDENTGAVGAVHAGWRSTVQDIAGVAVKKFAALGAGPAHIRAAIGPGIGLCCFETGPEVPEAVLDALGEGGHDCAHSKDNHKYMVDIKEVNRRLLLRAGLLPAHISVATQCTMCDPKTFWSHRATGGKRGSLAAIITSGVNP